MSEDNNNPQAEAPQDNQGAPNPSGAAAPQPQAPQPPQPQVQVTPPTPEEAFMDEYSKATEAFMDSRSRIREHKNVIKAKKAERDAAVVALTAAETVKAATAEAVLEAEAECVDCVADSVVAAKSLRMTLDDFIERHEG